MQPSNPPTLRTLQPSNPPTLLPLDPSTLRPFDPPPLRPFDPSPLRPFAPSPFAPSPLKCPHDDLRKHPSMCGHWRPGGPFHVAADPQRGIPAVGLDLVYVAFHVDKGDVRRAMDGVRALGIRGLSVTIPHKLDIIPCLDQVDRVARNIGSVNTVVHRDGQLLGCSTDGPGALRALAAEGVDPSGQRLLMLGSGGAARAIAFTLATLDPVPQLEILGVLPAELETLGGDLREKTRMPVATAPLDDQSLAASLAAADIIIHATPIGMTPKTDASIVPADQIRPSHAVFDAVYTPLETKLLRDAKAAGAKVVPGVGMFVHQAAIQFEMWTDREAPIDVMTQTVIDALEKTT